VNTTKPALLEVDTLTIAFRRDDATVMPVRGVSLAVAPGERVALVGESGCGKSLTALSLTRLTPTDRAAVGGAIRFEGRDLLGPDAAATRRALSELRRSGIAYVFQDPAASLNPVMRVGSQIAECLPDLPRAARPAEIVRLLQAVGLPDPARAAEAYPCELSGGQQQRVMLAMALAARPRLLVADEPTTALDVTTQQQVLALIRELADARGMAVLLITHNLGIVARDMRRMYVMYAGQIVESGPVRAVMADPRHPYTAGLLRAVPSLDLRPDEVLQDIPGTVPSPGDFPAGCGFSPRCARATDRCRQEMPTLRPCGADRAVRCHFPLEADHV